MNISTAIEGSKAFITVSEGASGEDFNAIYPVLDSADLSEICIDLKDLLYIKSLQIAELLAIKKWASKKNIGIALLNVDEGVYHALDISGLAQMFQIRQDYGRYTTKELINMFNDANTADEASNYLASYYSDDVKKILTENIKELPDSPYVQEYSILTVGRAHDSDAEDAVRKCLDSHYPNVIRAAILVLGWLGDVSSKDRMYEFIQSPFMEIAEAAGASLALLSDESDAVKIGALGKTDNPKLRMIVAGTLSLINGNEAFDILINMYESERDPDVRKVLVRRISFFNKPEATELLIGLLDDSSMAIQEAAAAGLERTGLRGHYDAVLKKIASSNNWVSYFAVKALGRQCTEECADYLIREYHKVADNVKLAIVEALGFTHRPQTQAFLLERLKENNEDIRKEALSSLAAISAEAAAAEAKKLVRADDSWLVRYRALEILEKNRPAEFDSILAEVRQKDDNRYIREKVLSILGN